MALEIDGLSVSAEDFDIRPDSRVLVPGAGAGSDIDRAFAAIMVKRRLYDLLYRYYDGNAPLKYSTKRLRDAFGRHFGIYFAENWLAVVIDSMLDRLSFQGFDLTSAEQDKKLDALVSATRLVSAADDVHEGALVCGESFLIIWKEGERVDAYYNDPRMCHVFYDGDRPDQKAFAAKYWLGDSDGKARMVLYYPDRLEHYIAADANPSSGSAFRPDDPEREPNPTGAVPVFHFRTRKRRGKLDLDRALRSMQDAVNKLFSDMMVAAEFTALRQRVIISQADPGDLKTFENWWIPAGDGVGQQSQVSELGGAPLDNFLKAIADTAAAMGIISRTPRHYFFQQGSDPSGDALLAMEAPLVKKVMKRQDAFSETWQEVALFLAQLLGLGSLQKSDVTVVWDPVVTLQPGAGAEVIKTQTDSGIPLVTALRRQGWSKSDIDQLKQDQADAKKAGVTGLAGAALNALRAQNEQSPDTGGGPGPGAGVRPPAPPPAAGQQPAQPPAQPQLPGGRR